VAQGGPPNAVGARHAFPRPTNTNALGNRRLPGGDVLINLPMIGILMGFLMGYYLNGGYWML